MKPIAWSTLVTLNDWTDALERLLTAAESARATNNARAVREVQTALVTFTKQSPAMANALDDIAHEAARDLYLARLDQALRQLAARKKALADARQLIEEATAQARRDTADIRLENVRLLVEKTMAALKAYERIRRNLESADDDVLRSVRAALNALADFAHIADRHP
jgi:predicted  nucleic acid-binding Zn-ribbon protein